MEFLERIIEMTSFEELIFQPEYLLMISLSLLLLYLGIVKKYEPLLLVPIGFGVLIANIPGANLGVVKIEESLGLLEIAKEYGIINLLYYSLIKTGFLPPIIFMGIGALTDFGPMLKNLRLVFFGAAAQFGIFTVLILASWIGFSNQEAAALAIIGGADGPTAIYTSTIFLGLSIGATMTPSSFLNLETIGIIVGGLFAFMISIFSGIMAVKIYNLFIKKKINPLIGATGLSAVPMASRVANELALNEDNSNHIMHYAMASNIAGVIGSAVAAGILITFLS